MEWLNRLLDKPAGCLTKDAKARSVYLLAFFIPFLIVGLLWAFHGVWPFGDQMILAHDQWHQYYPFYLDLHRKLQNGNSLLFSWTGGMGTNYLSLMAYYLASPFNFLAALLPESWLLPFYTLSVLVRIGCAGLFFAIMLRSLFDRKERAVAFFSTAYALCAFFMGYYWNAIWLDTVAILPLVVLGTLRLLRERKYILYTATLALSILMSYYIGLFTCIFVLLIFIGECICNREEGGGFWSRFFRIAFFTLLAVGMTALLSIPAYLGLKSTSSSVNRFPTKFAINMGEEATLLGVLDAVRQVFSNLGAMIAPTTMEGLPNIYCGVVIFALAMLYFCCKKVPLREKIYCAFLLVFFTMSFIIRQLDYILHGGHFPNMLPYRFSFLFSFVLIYMAYRAFTQLDRFRWYHALCILPLLGGMLYCVITQHGARAIVATAFVLAAVVTLLLLYGTKQITKNVLTLLLCAGLLCELTAGALLGVNKVGTTTKSVYPTAGEDVEAVVEQMNQRQTNTTDRWRAETALKQTLNDNALNGYNGISVFSSAANSNVSALLKTLGMASSVAGNRYCYQEADAFTNLILNLKYLIDREGYYTDPTYFTQVGSSGDVLLLENDVYLPMGFMVDDDLVNYDVDEASTTNYYDNLNEFYQRLSGSSNLLYRELPLSSSQTISGPEMSSSSGQNSYSLNQDDTDGEREYSFTYRMPYDCHLCLYIRTSRCKSVTLYVNEVEQYSYDCGYGYNRYLGQFSAGDEVTVHVFPKAGKDGQVAIEAAAFQTDVFDALYDRLSQQTLQADTVTDTELSGRIRVTAPGLFYTSIPYDSGWTATVDGKEVRITPVGDAFVAFHLDTGSHTIELQYETPGFRLGLKISLICLVIYLALVILAVIRRILRRPIRQVQVTMAAEDGGQPSREPEEEPMTGTDMPQLDVTRIMEPVQEPDAPGYPEALDAEAEAPDAPETPDDLPESWEDDPVPPESDDVPPEA